MLSLTCVYVLLAYSNTLIDLEYFFYNLFCNNTVTNYAHRNNFEEDFGKLIAFHFRGIIFDTEAKRILFYLSVS